MVNVGKTWRGRGRKRIAVNQSGHKAVAPKKEEVPPTKKKLKPKFIRPRH